MSITSGQLAKVLGTPAKGRVRVVGMNKTEAAYGERLEWKRRAGEVLWFKFEPCSLRLADHTHYRPDFLVMMADGTLEVHEVKGHWEDDARAKIKIAASLFPFVFRAMKLEKREWIEEVI